MLAPLLQEVCVAARDLDDARKGLGFDVATTTLTQGAFPGWATARRTDGSHDPATPVLAMPLVSPRLADLCQQAHWSWLDLSGNCWIDVPGCFHIDRSGNPPVCHRVHPGANLGSAASAGVLRVLLSPAHARRAWTQRDIQGATRCEGVEEDRPVSLGLVNRVMRHLRTEGYVAGDDQPGVRLADPLGLLKVCSEAYRFDRHQRRSYFTLLKPEQLERGLDKFGAQAGAMARYAAFSAAERQAPRVRQPRTWIYVAAPWLERMATHTQSREVDSGENLVVLVPEDAGVFLSFDVDRSAGAQGLVCTDPVQTYLDLLHCGGRGEEAAQAVLEQRMLQAWRAAGIT